LIERGLAVSPEDVQRVRRAQMVSAIAVDRMFDRYDALLTPSSAGEAERGSGAGSAVFNGIWTAMHLPCITIPSSRGPNGLPVGVQLVGRRGRDRELLGLARRVARCLIG
jgi:Asp-tRNA(Asn)/Glu-tRNA(Gln) amidotransferase A subunit family amidase